MKGYVNNNLDSMIKCPYSKDYDCGFYLQDREIRALVTAEDYEKVQLRSLRQSEATIPNTFHCKYPDCIGIFIIIISKLLKYFLKK